MTLSCFACNPALVPATYLLYFWCQFRLSTDINVIIIGDRVFWQTLCPPKLTLPGLRSLLSAYVASCLYRYQWRRVDYQIFLWPSSPSLFYPLESKTKRSNGAKSSEDSRYLHIKCWTFHLEIRLYEILFLAGSCPSGMMAFCWHCVQLRWSTSPRMDPVASGPQTGASSKKTQPAYSPRSAVQVTFYPVCEHNRLVTSILVDLRWRWFIKRGSLNSRQGPKQAWFCVVLHLSYSDNLINSQLRRTVHLVVRTTSLLLYCYCVRPFALFFCPSSSNCPAFWVSNFTKNNRKQRSDTEINTCIFALVQ